MYRIRRTAILAGLVALAMGFNVFAQQKHGIECQSCQVNYLTRQNLADAIADVEGVDVAAVTVMDGTAPGTFRVRLPDDRNFSVAPVGLVFRHQNMVERRVNYTDEGGLRLRTQTRMELQLRSAIHREDEVIGEMIRLGWNDFYWFRHGMEVDSPQGVRYCLQPDMSVYPDTAPAAISITEDTDGNLVVIHTDGIRQRLHACAHDQLQLRDRVRMQLHQELGVDSNGNISVEANGNTVRYRLSAQLRWSGTLDEPGFFYEASRLFLRYRDGWEQEIIALE